MFEDSLIESGGRLKTKRGRTTLVSFILEAVVVVVLILIPLMFTEALPKGQLMTFLVAPPPPPPPPPPPAAVKIVKAVETDIVNNQLRTPTKIPKQVKIIQEEEAPPSTGIVGGVPGGVPGGAANGVIGGIISSTPVAVPKVAVQRVRVSQGVTQGMKVHDVTPQYPQMAKIARVQGPVVLAAVIGKDGTIQGLRVVSSASPLLNQSALEAVKQWRYRPYILNGEPVEVDTTITVNFTLSGG
ncbi:MAG TPA: TonB family protein [Terriglobales bacterium]|nr:TonB family protein [Terriglobales bacterium]